ncbi:MAG: EamA family transporter, partial [Actinomycetota bacterium]
FAAYNILAAAVSRSMGALRAHAAGFGIASIIWIAVQAPRGVPRSVLDLSVAPRIAWVAIVGTVVAFGVYAFGIARLGASSATIISTLEPVATVFLGWLVLGQTLDALQSTGALLVLCGVVALSIHVSRR